MTGPVSPADQLRQMGAAADLEYWQVKAKELTRDADWEKLQEINARHGREIKTQNRKYHLTYEKRFEMACKHIASSRGERFDRLKRRKDPRSQKLTKLIGDVAKRDVETDHDRRLGTMRESHAKELRDLVEVALARASGPEGPQRLLTDGRSNPDLPVPDRKR